MNLQLSDKEIRLLCGRFSYERGESYFQSGMVTFTQYETGSPSVYKAAVAGSERYDVAIEIRPNGNIYTECSCDYFTSYDENCKHIAAVLLSIRDNQLKGTVPSLSAGPHADARLVSSMIALFSDKPAKSPSAARSLFETRETLTVEITIRPIPTGKRKLLFGLELKVGADPKRLYVVQKLSDFLGKMDRGEACVFSSSFTYDPARYIFNPTDHAILSKLVQILKEDREYREQTRFAYGLSGAVKDRVVMLPPIYWESLLPLLTKAEAVRLEHAGEEYDGIRLADEPLPLFFEFNDGGNENEDEGFRLNVDGLEQVTIMEAYGLVLSGEKLLRASEEQCARLAELKRMLDRSGGDPVKIGPEHIEMFMDKVLPGLTKLGSVRIADSISDRIVRPRLKAKLYLDRVRDRLLAGLEFQYGDIVINPLEPKNRRRGEGRILVRDTALESRIFELMEQGAFAQTESGFFMDGEEHEYDFLYHVLPELEKLVDVYATTAVKERLLDDIVIPKISVKFDERTDWLEFKFDMSGIPESEIRQVVRSVEEKRKYHRLKNGALLPLEGEAFSEMIRFMNEVGIRKGDWVSSELRLPAVRAARLVDAAERGWSNVEFDASLRRMLSHLRNPDHLDFPIPAGLAHVLRDYQKYGYQWMKTLAHYRFGGILADEMGLGKTLQSIAYLVSVLPDIRSRRLPALVVCPASLVYNWRNELRKFAPEVRVAIADGSKRDRSMLLREIGQAGVGGGDGIESGSADGSIAGTADVVITSYPLLRMDLAMYAKLAFHTLFLDEAQVFKNYATKTAQAVKTIKADWRFALTGTPIENRLEELWSIYDAVFPELFPGGRKSFAELQRETVARRVRPFLLRRVKRDVLKDLPEKLETMQVSELLPEQKKLYLAYLAKLKQDTLKHLREEGFQKNRIRILAGITRLRQLCCHPALFVEGYAGSSAKFEQLLEIVEEALSAGKRMLIFSQFTEMLGLIGRELAYQGVPYFYLDGSTPAADRVELCDRFNGGERDLFLISLKAGGTGLNLTGADTVLLYDLWWNPAVEQQASDRAHRIGQKRVVQVIRLVAEGTVEEKMFELQQRKKDLIEAVVEQGQEALSALTEDEVREILMLSDN